jgi:hypothetical protein
VAGKAPAASLAELSPEDFYAITRRAHNAAVRAINQGAGLFFVAIVLTATFAISMRIAVPRLMVWRDALADSVGSLFKSELDTTATRPIKPVVAIVTAALAEGRGTQDLLQCEMPGRECAALANAQKAIDDVSKLADVLYRIARADCVPAATIECIRPLVEERLHTLNGSFSPGAVGSLAETLALVTSERLGEKSWVTRAQASIADCITDNSQDGHVTSHRAASLPNAGCDKTPSSAGIQTQIPQQLKNATKGQNADYNERVLAATVEARLFDYVVDRLQSDSPTPSSSDLTSGQQDTARQTTINNTNAAASIDEGTLSRYATVGTTPSVARRQRAPKLVQAYFMSVDSVLRIWDPRRDPMPLPANRLWSQAMYFSALLNSDRPFIESGVYVDTGGNGLVRTYCYPFSVTRVLSDKAERTSFDGGFCFDFGLPSDKEVYESLLETLNSNPLVEAEVVRLELAESGHVSGMRKLDGEAINDEILGVRTADLESNIVQGHDFVDAGHYVTYHEVSSVQMVLVPLSRWDDRTVIAFVMRPRGLKPPSTLIISGAIAAFSLLGVIVTVFRLGGSRRESVLDAQLARLRSLPVGVIETDLNHYVTAANDRAEELVDRVLPKIGVAERGPPVTFDALFEEYVYEINESNGALDRLNKSVIGQRRRAGERSSYFAKVLPRHEGDQPSPAWVKLFVSPLLPLGTIEYPSKENAGRSELWMPAFGVVLECTMDEIAAIEEWRPREKGADGTRPAKSE